MTRQPAWAHTVLACCVLVLSLGCSRYRPQPMDSIPFMERAQTEDRDGLRVTTSVMGPEESKRPFGVDLPRKGIQPVWIQVQNNTDRYYGLLMSGIDPNYFSAREAAYKSHFWMRGGTNKKIDEHFGQHGLVPEARPAHCRPPRFRGHRDIRRPD